MPPLISWGHKKRLSNKAVLFTVALRIYEDSLCDCGHSNILAWDEFNSGEYQQEDDILCLACEVLGSDDSKLSPGQKRVVVNHIDDDILKASLPDTD